MSLFNRPNPFHQQDVGAFKKPLRFGELCLFVVIYALISMGGPLLVGLVIPMFTGVSLVFMLVGLQVGIYWLCRRFYRRTGRSMTRQEYHWAFWRVFLSLCIFYFIVGSLGILSIAMLASDCQGQLAGPQFCQSALGNPTPALYFSLVAALLIALLVNLGFIGLWFKNGLRGVLKSKAAAQNAQQVEDTTT